MNCVFFAHDEEEIQTRIRLVESLKTALRTQSMRYIEELNIFSYFLRSFFIKILQLCACVL